MRLQRVQFSIAAFVGATSLTATVPVAVFTRFESGYECIKIPSLLSLSSGTLLAFGEGRRESCSDYAFTELVSKRSTDGGKSWGSLTVVYTGANVSAPSPSAYKIVGNAAPMQLPSGRILLIFCGNNSAVFIGSSDDDGVSWTPPRELVSATLPSWHWVGTGPPAALRLSTGRLIVPSYHSSVPGDDGDFSSTHTILSDDDGESWRLGGGFSDGLRFPNENQIVVLSSGELLCNARTALADRIGAVSNDGGESWGVPTPLLGLTQSLTGCEGSTVRMGDVLFYSGPAATTVIRKNLSLWTAPAIKGSPWSEVGVIYSGASAYSALVPLPPSQLGLLFEASNRTLIIFEPDAILFTRVVVT